MAEKKLAEWLTVEEFRQQSRLGRNTVYNAIRANHLPHVRVGRRILIPGDSLQRMMMEHLNGEVSGNAAHSSPGLNEEADANPD